MALPANLETERGHAVGMGWAHGYPWDPSEWSPELAWPTSIIVFARSTLPLFAAW